MKIVLIGPYPPPHGGISVHVQEAGNQLHMAGTDCRVVNVDPHALESSEYLRVRGGVDLFFKLFGYARKGWTLHVHTNGHNRNSWLITLTAGLAGIFGQGNLLTLHSGLVPDYLAPGQHGTRLMARLSCLFYRRVIAVSPEVRDAVISVGVDASRVDVLPSFLFRKPPFIKSQLPIGANRGPILGTTLFFRPEYGFPLLVEAMDQLRGLHPAIACLVMGSGEQRADSERLVAKRGLTPFIFFLGNLAHEKCLSVISQCDIFVRPALVDGDANCVREAQSLGVPVVASAVGHRPPGTILFQSGNVDDLVLKIEEAWLRPIAEPPARNASGSIQSLIDVYASL